MIKAIGALEQLQRIDLEISAIEEEEKTRRKEIDRLNAEIEKIDEELASLEPDLQPLEDRLAEYKELIRQNEEKIKKDEGRIGSVKNDKELNALNKGIRAATKANKQYEEELGNVQSRADELRARIEEKGAARAERAGEIEKLRAEAKEKASQWQNVKDEKARERESLKTDIRADVLRKYEAIRSRRGGRGLVPVKSETCQGCFIHIPPQVYIELKKGTDELIMCPHCHRILYFDRQGEENENRS